jgi:hypothetical protein
MNFKDYQRIFRLDDEIKTVKLGQHLIQVCRTCATPPEQHEDIDKEVAYVLSDSFNEALEKVAPKGGPVNN